MARLGAFAFLGWLCSFLIPETMGRSLENLAGEEPEDHEETPTGSWLEIMWVSCTPVVMWEWFWYRQLRQTPTEDDGVETVAVEQISLPKPEGCSPSSEGDRLGLRSDLPETQVHGGLHILEGEFEKTSSGSPDRRDPGDEIERVTQ